MNKPSQISLVVWCVFTVVFVLGQECVYQMNSITDIPAGTLPPNLTQIYFTNNPLTTIADTAFDDSASTLDTLYLSQTNFTRFPDAFRQLKILKYLNIEEANIHEWNEDIMKNIGQTMQSLVLDNAGITTWPNWLKYFSRLTDLTITRASISIIPDGALDNCSKTLTSLSLFSNKLIAVPKAFSKLIALQSLSLQENQIVDVSWLPSSSELTTLSLSNNHIADAKVLSKALCPFDSSLTHFDIESNRLSAIPDLSCLRNIQNVDLTDNKISDPYSGAFAPTVRSIFFTRNFLSAIPRVLTTLQSVPELTLSSNSITQIRGSDFPLSTSTVELGFNLIMELTDDSFPENSSITDLRLNNNPIFRISNNAFKNLASLTELSLQSTRLTRIPLALSSFNKLYVLDMTATDTLVCTCQETSLRPWILSMTSNSILGNCGLTSIYEFFLKLSPLCPSS